MSVSKESKLTVLTQIRENKELLFGSFSNKLTAKDKEAKWKEILNSAVELGVIQEGKQWTYLRDVTWQNWRKRTVERKDHKHATGKGGGREVQYDDVDLVVLDILGKNSPMMEGLPVPESSGTSSFTVSMACSSQREVTAVPLRKRQRGLGLTKTAEEEDDSVLRRKKLVLQVESLMLDNMKKNLDILEIERNLHLAPSKCTTDFLRSQYENDSETESFE